jgi:hypothetical protein
MKRGIVAAFAGMAALSGVPSAQAAPTADLHEIRWFVHIDLIDPGMGRDLAFYEAVLDAALEDVRTLLEGDQGPLDQVCCSQLVKEEHSPGVTLATFGSPGDGLDVMSVGEFPSYTAAGGSGSRAFLIDSITNCGGGGPGIGCSQLPGCDSTPDDDPNLVMIVTMAAEDSGLLGQVIAHERGHNACLGHVLADPCEIMAGSISGGCISGSECVDYTAGRTTTGGTCACHADTPTPEPETDGTACSDGPLTGQCSGGLCGATPGDAGVELMASGGPESNTGATTNDPLLQSGLTGGWFDLGAFGSTLRGLAHDTDSGTLYGVREVAAADDALVLVDPNTGAVTSTIGTITGHADVISLAFDPGATPGTGDDRLLALSTDGSFEDLIEIAPATGAPTSLGPLSVGVVNNFTGLAYDSGNDKLYAAGFAGGSLWEIDISSCGNPFFCVASEVLSVNLPRDTPSLAYSPDSGRLYMIGRQTGDRILYDTIDATTFSLPPTVGIDGYTVGGLAAIPVPEPTSPALLGAGCALLLALGRRRHGKSAR